MTHSPHSRPLGRAAAGLACAAALVCAAPATAAEPEPAVLDFPGDSMVYTAGAGVNNTVVLDGTGSPIDVLVSDRAAPSIRYRQAFCEPTKVDKQLLCDAAPDGIQVDLRDGNDSLTVTSRYLTDLPLRVECGEGRDSVRVLAHTTVAPDCEEVDRVCFVPRVKGLTVAKARARLRDAGCGVRVRRVFSNKVRRGRVVKASARPGAALEAGTVVKLTVSKGRR